LLTGGARTAVARQRTLEATLDWSFQLLSDGERQLLSRLSVFPAVWTLEAAENVCSGDGINENDVLDLLSRLVSKSLVVVDREFPGERRYRFLETVRQYARERLVQAGAADRLRDRHFEFFFNAGVSPATADRAGERPVGARMGTDVFNSCRKGRRARWRAVLVLDEARPVR
jgi:non-specific serine/threonine protein kinase